LYSKKAKPSETNKILHRIDIIPRTTNKRENEGNRYMIQKQDDSCFPGISRSA